MLARWVAIVLASILHVRAIHENVWALAQDSFDRNDLGDYRDEADDHDGSGATAYIDGVRKEKDSVERKACIQADSGLITWQGRTVKGSTLDSDPSSSSSRSFTWPGVQAMFNVKGASKVFMTVSAIFVPYEAKEVDPRFHIYVDGKCNNTVIAKLENGKMLKQRLSLLDGLDTNKSHQIIVYYLTDPRMVVGKRSTSFTAGAVTIHDFALDHGKFDGAPKQRKRRLLFVGDSQMAGYAVTHLKHKNKSCARGQDLSGGYAAMICERLGANCTYLTVSGIGMYHNCCNDDPPMFDLFTRALPGIDHAIADFSDFAPNGIVVDVGENDENFVWPDTKNMSFISKFIDRYVQFLGLLVKLHDDPDMKIFLVVDRTYHYADWIETAVQNFKKLDFPSNEILILGFNAYDSDDACNHPTSKGQRQISEAIRTRIAKALDWTWPKKPLGIKKLKC